MLISTVLLQSCGAEATVSNSTNLNRDKRVLIVLPEADFDPTEVSVPWSILSERGVKISFAGPSKVSTDMATLTGDGLGLFSFALKASPNIVPIYERMIQSKEFRERISWDAIQATDYDGVILPGGHAPGMKSYLESVTLRHKILDFYNEGKRIAAICHGVLLLARTQNKDGRSILFGHKVTTLLKTQELSAWALTYPWLKDYYRTYPETTENEVTRLIGGSEYFERGPIPLRRDSEDDQSAGFVVEDGPFLTARWPGDVHTFALRLAASLDL